LVFAVISTFLFLILLIWVFPSNFIQICQGFINLINFFKELDFGFVDSLYWYFDLSLVLAFIFTASFLLLVLCFACSQTFYWDFFPWVIKFFISKILIWYFYQNFYIFIEFLFISCIFFISFSSLCELSLSSVSCLYIYLLSEFVQLHIHILFNIIDHSCHCFLNLLLEISSFSLSLFQY
jgi:hypothetical protein